MAVALAEAALAGMEADGGGSADVLAPGPFWTEARLALNQELWGEGFLNPGGGAEVLRLAAPLGLSEAISLLLVGVGIGGPAQVLANDFGVWVASHESDPTLVPLAKHRLLHARAIVAKRATVETWSPAAPRFRRRGSHHVIALDALRAGVTHTVLSSLWHAIKPGGQLVLQELVADAPLDRAEPAVEAWCRLEHRSPELPAETFVTETLTRLGFEVRVAEDQSSRHVGLVVQGWKGLIRGLNGARPPHGYAAALVDEAELWTRRIGLIHAGRIRMVRWHAIA
jgi:hypothetical protein